MPHTEEISAYLKKFGSNVRRERMAKGISQEKLSEMANISLRNLQKVEAGQLNILVTTTARIQQAIGCPWETLMPSKVQDQCRICKEVRQL